MRLAAHYLGTLSFPIPICIYSPFSNDSCNIPAQSPSTSSDSSDSSDTEQDLNVSMKNKTKGRQKSKSADDKKDDRALRDIQPVELDGRVRFSSVSY